MRAFNIPDINTPTYWDEHQTALDYGLRQQKYAELAGNCDKLVELGCGLSPFLDNCASLRTFGVDYSVETIKKAHELYPDVEYIVADCTKTPFIDKYFDVSVAGEVIEHLKEPELLIKEMERITKGVIIISTPHLEFEDPEHLWEFDEGWFRERGFSVETIHSERFIGRSYIFAWKKVL